MWARSRALPRRWAVQRHLLGPPGIKRQHVDAKTRLQRRVAVELVEDDVGDRVALELDDDADAVAIALVAQVGDALDQFLADDLGDALDHARLVHLIRYLGDDDRLALLAQLLDMGLAAHHDRAASGAVGGDRTGAADDDPAGRKIRRRHDLHQLLDGDRRIVDIADAGIDDLAEIVRRNIRRHADGDASAAVDHEIGEGRGEDHRLARSLVVVRDEIDRVLLHVIHEGRAQMGHPRLGVTHRGRRVTLDRAEIPLPVDQPLAHRVLPCG